MEQEDIPKGLSTTPERSNKVDDEENNEEKDNSSLPLMNSPQAFSSLSNTRKYSRDIGEEFDYHTGNATTTTRNDDNDELCSRDDNEDEEEDEEPIEAMAEEEDDDDDDDDEEISVKSTATTEDAYPKEDEEGEEADSSNGSPRSQRTSYYSDSKSKPRKASKSSSSSKKGRTPSVKGLSIPFRTVKKSMKQDLDIPIVQNEAAIMTTLAVELFLKKLAQESYRNARNRGRSVIRYEDIAEARTSNQALAFLEPLLP